MTATIRAVRALAVRPAPITAATGHRLADAYRAQTRELEHRIADQFSVDAAHAKAIAMETWTVAIRRLETGVRVRPEAVLPWLMDLSYTAHSAIAPLLRALSSPAVPLAA
jgi:hypothetical protein